MNFWIKRTWSVFACLLSSSAAEECKIAPDGAGATAGVAGCETTGGAARLRRPALKFDARATCEHRWTCGSQQTVQVTTRTRLGWYIACRLGDAWHDAEANPDWAQRWLNRHSPSLERCSKIRDGQMATRMMHRVRRVG